MTNPDDKALDRGLTKREYFATLAMQGLLGSAGWRSDQKTYLADSRLRLEADDLMQWADKSTAIHAVALADVLIAALNEER